MLEQTKEGLTFTPEGATPEALGKVTGADFDRFIQIVGCGTRAHAQAVFAVEAAGSGFTMHRGKRVPKILFEAHIFFRFTGKWPVSKVAPHLSSKSWDRSLYTKTAQPLRPGANLAHTRLEEAVALDELMKANGEVRQAALMSCSWGIGQVMGLNWKPLGYPSLQQFINEMFDSEGRQLDAVARFIKVNKLGGAMCRKDWAAFARGYNGPGFKQNAYDARLAVAYRRAGGK